MAIMIRRTYEQDRKLIKNHIALHSLTISEFARNLCLKE